MKKKISSLGKEVRTISVYPGYLRKLAPLTEGSVGNELSGWGGVGV